MTAKGVDASKLRVSPNSPLAAQIIEDKVIDMLLFVTFRYIKNFETWKNKQINECDMRIQMATRDSVQHQANAASGSVTQGTSKSNRSKASSQLVNQHEEIKQNMQRLENNVLQRMTHLLKSIVY